MARKKQPVDIGRAQRLDSLIKESGLKQKEVADKCGYVPQVINAMVKGRAHITEDKAKLIIEKAFPNVRVEWLLGYTDYRTEEEETAAAIAADYEWALSNKAYEDELMEARRGRLKVLSEYASLLVDLDYFCHLSFLESSDPSSRPNDVAITQGDEGASRPLEYKRFMEFLAAIDDFANYAFCILVREHIMPKGRIIGGKIEDHRSERRNIDMTVEDFIASIGGLEGW